MSVIGNFVTSIKKCMREAGLEALPVPVESLRLRLRQRSNTSHTTMAPILQLQETTLTAYSMIVWTYQRNSQTDNF